MTDEDAEYVEKYGGEMAALRKIVYTLADEEPGNMGIVPAANKAIERIAELEKQVQDNTTTAQSALGVVQGRAKADGGESKTQYAARQTRNELVKRAALERSDQRIAANRVQDMCSPQYDVKYQTVKDAWGKLIESWPCFKPGSTEDGLNALVVKRAHIPDELAHAVSDNLGREDLAKRLISQNHAGGG